MEKHASSLVSPISSEQLTGSSELFSGESVLNVLKLILSGARLAEVLSIIAELVDSRGDGTFCTIWLPTESGNHLYCAAAPNISGFIAGAGTMEIGPQGGSCGAAVYRREPVFAIDVLTDPIWDVYRDRILPFGIRAVWSQPLFTRDGKVLGTFAIHYREVRSPNNLDLRIIENASRIAAIAIERHQNEDTLRLERDRLRLLLEITNGMASKLNLQRLLEALSTDLLRVTLCDFCAVLLPNDDKKGLRITTLYNPEARGSLVDGTYVLKADSFCGEAFRTGTTQFFNNCDEIRLAAEPTASRGGKHIQHRFTEEEFVSGCSLPLLGRNGVIGVLTALNRSKKAFEQDEVSFLEQLSRQVALAIENALEYEKAIGDRDKETKQRLYLEEEVRAEFGKIVGDSPALRVALEMVSIVAPTGSSVLILGETGTGKELIARAIHNLSSRRDRPFVKLNCAAIPLGLLESELFGHERGAFTGAIAQKTGRFELANKGTLFLDEVGDIPLELQAKLLRVLQEQEFERLGGTHTHKVDVRVIAATHRDLPAMVKQTTFREDLYYRLKVFPIKIPALRQRTEDIPNLVRHFVDFYARRMNKRIDNIPLETMDALTKYRWPGNVRELQNFIERTVILSPHTVLRAPIADLEPYAASKGSSPTLSNLEEMERDHILRALDASKWIVGGRHGAAERLGVKRTSLVYKMQKLGISRGSSMKSAPGNTSLD